jgi:hypothetical protein
MNSINKYHKYEYSSMYILCIFYYIHWHMKRVSFYIKRDTITLVFHIPNTKNLCNKRTLFVSQIPIFTLRDISVTSAAASVHFACIRISVNTHQV